VAHEQVRGASEEIVRGVFRLLCRYAGERVAIKRFSEELSARSGSGVSATQVNAAIDYLENTLLIRLLKPLEIGRKRHTSPPTICLCDHFMRYALLREEIPLAPWLLKGKNEALATQAGHLVEGIVGNMFASAQGVDAFFFPERKDEPEVDVVLSIGLKHLPIEVKYRTRLKATDFAGVRSFCDKKYYDAPFGLVISQEQSGEVEPGVIVVPAKALLLLL
jgi:predicted AAA+ superfamily ATPase